MIKLDHGKKMTNDVIGTDKNSWSGISLQENNQKFRELHSKARPRNYLYKALCALC